MEELRSKAVELINKKLLKYNDTKEIIFISENIEKGIYDKFSDNTNKYKKQLRIILSNIDITPNSVHVRKKLFDGVWNPYEVGKMNENELNPEIFEELRLEQEREDQIIQNMRNKKLAVDSIYTCGKCKNNKVEYYQKQTRSADEPMSVFVSCLICNNRWRC